MTTLEKLKEIYAEYYSGMEQVRESERGLRGAMNVFVLGPKDRNACNIRFNEKAKAALAESAPEEAGELVDFVLSQGWAHRDWLAVELMLTAVHGYLTPLLPLLPPEQRKQLGLWYDRCYPRINRTPVMRSFRKALG